MRVLELAAECSEAVLGKGARSMSTSALEVEHTRPWGGTRHQHRGGRPRREERHGMVALILDRQPPEKPRTGGVRLKLSYPTNVESFEVGAPILPSHPSSPLVGTHHRW
jgi:hypothetical protein